MSQGVCLGVVSGSSLPLVSQKEHKARPVLGGISGVKTFHFQNNDGLLVRSEPVPRRWTAKKKTCYRPRDALSSLTMLSLYRVSEDSGI